MVFFAWVFAATGAIAVFLYLIPAFQIANRYTVMAASFIPYGTIAWFLSAVIFLAAGRGWGKPYLCWPSLV